MSTRWSGSDVPRGEDYDARWARRAEAGESVHGEADLVEALLVEHGGRRVLDAGCGTGRVAIELAARGFDVVGVDVDPRMLGTARAKAPALQWVEADLAGIAGSAELPGAAGGGGFDLVVLAGNVMIFLDPGAEAAVVHDLGAQLRDGGLLVAGFQLRAEGVRLADYDRWAAEAGLEPVARWATWDRDPFTGGDYAVSVHRALPRIPSTPG